MFQKALKEFNFNKLLLSVQSFDILSRNYNSYNFGPTVKFGLPVRPYGIFYSGFRFSIIRPSGFGLMDSTH